MSNSIYTAPIYKLKELNNLFIELTEKNCNQRCAKCYIDFPISRNTRDFISLEKIKEALNDTKHENIYCIYLTGAEPMTHPDFNSILRLCLKRCNVCICTNGSFLNEKKIRFLKKVEDEGLVNKTENQIFFKLSLAHFNELESDKVRYRGNFRQTIFALKTLSRYNFNSVLSISILIVLAILLKTVNKLFLVNCSNNKFSSFNFKFSIVLLANLSIIKTPLFFSATYSSTFLTLWQIHHFPY